MKTIFPKPRSPGTVATDLGARLKELSALRDGWFNGAGKAPAEEGLRWLADAWAQSYPRELPDPYAYPTVDGYVQLEWTLGTWELSAEVHFGDRTALITGVNVATGDGVEQTADLNSSEGWKNIEALIRTHLA